MTAPARATNWDRVAAVASAGALVLALIITLFSGIWNLGSLVTEDELRASEDRLLDAINNISDRTDAQMEELRRYMINHLDGHPGRPSND